MRVTAKVALIGIALVCCLALLRGSQAQSPQGSAPAKSGARTSSHTRKGRPSRVQPRATVLFHPDMDCTVKVDGKIVGPVKKDGVQSAKLSLGEHIIQAYSDPGGAEWEKTVYIIDTQQIVLSIPLKAIADAAAARQQAAAEKQREADQAQQKAAEEREELEKILRNYLGSWSFTYPMDGDWPSKVSLESGTLMVECRSSGEYSGSLNVTSLDISRAQVTGTMQFSRRTIAGPDGDQCKGDYDPVQDNCEAEVSRACNYREGGQVIAFTEDWAVTMQCAIDLTCLVDGTRRSCKGTNCPDDAQNVGTVAVGKVDWSSDQSDHFLFSFTFSRRALDFPFTATFVRSK